MAWPIRPYTTTRSLSWKISMWPLDIESSISEVSSISCYKMIQDNLWETLRKLTDWLYVMTRKRFSTGKLETARYHCILEVFFHCSCQLLSCGCSHATTQWCAKTYRLSLRRPGCPDGCFSTESHTFLRFHTLREDSCVFTSWLCVFNVIHGKG